jgi:hypothetical protein
MLSQYMLAKPAKADYPWLWREWIEGQNVPLPPPAAKE